MILEAEEKIKEKEKILQMKSKKNIKKILEKAKNDAATESEKMKNESKKMRKEIVLNADKNIEKAINFILDKVGN